MILKVNGHNKADEKILLYTSTRLNRNGRELLRDWRQLVSDGLPCTANQVHMLTTDDRCHLKEGHPRWEVGEALMMSQHK